MKKRDPEETCLTVGQVGRKGGENKFEHRKTKTEKGSDEESLSYRGRGVSGEITGKEEVFASLFNDGDDEENGETFYVPRESRGAQELRRVDEDELKHKC